MGTMAFGYVKDNLPTCRHSISTKMAYLFNLTLCHAKLIFTIHNDKYQQTAVME